MERVKAISRNSTATADAENYRPELIADEEPRYLRRQKPVEIRRKKLGGRQWSFYKRAILWGLCGAGVLTAGIFGARFLLYSPQMLLLKTDQIDVTGNHIVAREAIIDRFYRDRGRSVLRVPLDQRRSELEQLPWVESANVARILPDKLKVDITERTPVAFLRNGNEVALIDAHGVILDRPEGEDLHFPIVTGVTEALPREERERRMQTYQEFMQDVELVRAGSSDRVSEIDLGTAKDIRVVMTGLPGSSDSQALSIHFGQNDFTNKYRMLVENFAQWQANAGCVRSVDLRFTRQVVLNPDSSACGSSTQVASRAH